MSETAAGLGIVLARELRAFAREIDLFPDDTLVWKTVPGITNSAGNLALHVCGNLHHFVGRGLGQTGYVRDRDREFSRRSGSRAELVAEIQKTAGMIERVLPGLSDAALARDYPEPLYGMTLKTGLFLLHLSAHLAHHLGQAGYLRRALTGDERSSGPIAVKELGGSRPL